MKGGDFYIRVLMWIILVSEFNYFEFYYVVYIGKKVFDFSKYLDWCIIIVLGLNKGNCSMVVGWY